MAGAATALSGGLRWTTDDSARIRAARSTLKLAIEDTLDTLPAAYDRPLFAQKCSALFEHVYESYPERNAGVYAEHVP